MQGSRAWAATYMVLAMLGALLPLTAFLPWLALHGLDAPRFVLDLFVNPVSSFFGLDVIVSAIVLTVFIIVQGRRDDVGSLWLPIIATFLIGVSCGFPMFLALRERALAQRAALR